MNPKYPVYVISKGRHESRMTVKALTRMKVPFRVVIEPQEEEDYAAVIPRGQLLLLPFSNLGQGSIPARNWVWEHSIKEGHERHWILDDNLRDFVRLYKNGLYRVADGACFVAVENIVNRYQNIPMAGLNYRQFAGIMSHTTKPIILNTRIYSCILLDNSADLRWRGRYNEDTDLSLRFLKRGECTLLCNAFLAEKIKSMIMKGGNTDELYAGDGRERMVNSLIRQHPDVVTKGWRYGHVHHIVDYSPFKKNRPIPKPGARQRKIKMRKVPR